MSNLLLQVSIPIKILNKKNNMMIAGKRLIKSPKVITYETALRTAIHTVMGSCYSPTLSPVMVIITATFPDNRRRDIQNCLDIICDVMQGIVYIDDSQIEKIIADKKVVKGVSCLDISVYEI